MLTVKSMVPSPEDRTLPPRGTPEGDTEPVSAQRVVKPAPTSRAAHEYPHPVAYDFETDRYRGIEEIGRGGSSVVIRAFDKEILRDVAIKILDPATASDGGDGDRFAEEARISGQLEHPNIVPIYELSTDGAGRRFLSMKLIQGVTLDDTIRRLGDARLDPIHLAELLQVFVKVCDAVSFAHSRGVLHRDLKPKNVMISDFGQVYVLDWGIARLRTSSADHTGPRIRIGADDGAPSEPDPPGVLIGTACYMGPEQILGQHDALDERSDVFALGATLYQILTQRPPLTTDMVRAVWMRKPAPVVPPPDRVVPGGRVPPELSRIAMRAIAFEPRERYASVAELKRDIEGFQRGAWDLPRVRLDAGSVIVREGEAGDAAYVVLDGQCVAFRTEDEGEIELRTMGPGDVFGEMAVFSRKPRSASVRAVTEVRLLVVTGDVLSKALGLNSWTGAFVKALADRFREADQRLRALDRAGAPPSSQTPLRMASKPEDRGAASVPGAEKTWFQRAAAELPRKRVPAGSVVVAAGDSAGMAYIVLEGRCVHDAADAGETPRELGPGDVIGETAVLLGTTQTRVTALTDVELLVVGSNHLWDALRDQSWVAIFVKALASRLREANERLRLAESPPG
jgi:serine/threonine-protein kinase